MIENVDQFGSGQAGVERDEHTAGQRDRVVRDEHLRDVGCEIGDPLTARDPALENPGEALHLVGELRVTRATIPVDDRGAVAEHRCAAFKESQRTQFGPVGAATIDPAEVGVERQGLGKGRIGVRDRHRLLQIVVPRPMRTRVRAATFVVLRAYGSH